MALIGSASPFLDHPAAARSRDAARSMRAYATGSSASGLASATANSLTIGPSAWLQFRISLTSSAVQRAPPSTRANSEHRAGRGMDGRKPTTCERCPALSRGRSQGPHVEDIAAQTRIPPRHLQPRSGIGPLPRPILSASPKTMRRGRSTHEIGEHCFGNGRARQITPTRFYEAADPAGLPRACVGALAAAIWCWRSPLNISRWSPMKCRTRCFRRSPMRCPPAHPWPRSRCADRYRGGG